MGDWRASSMARRPERKEAVRARLQARPFVASCQSARRYQTAMARTAAVTQSEKGPNCQPVRALCSVNGTAGMPPMPPISVASLRSPSRPPQAMEELHARTERMCRRDAGVPEGPEADGGERRRQHGHPRPAHRRAAEEPDEARETPLRKGGGPGKDRPAQVGDLAEAAESPPARQVVEPPASRPAGGARAEVRVERRLVDEALLAVEQGREGLAHRGARGPDPREPSHPEEPNSIGTVVCCTTVQLCDLRRQTVNLVSCTERASTVPVVARVSVPAGGAGRLRQPARPARRLARRPGPSDQTTKGLPAAPAGPRDTRRGWRPSPRGAENDQPAEGPLLVAATSETPPGPRTATSAVTPEREGKSASTSVFPLNSAGSRAPADCQAPPERTKSPTTPGRPQAAPTRGPSPPHEPATAWIATRPHALPAVPAPSPALVTSVLALVAPGPATSTSSPRRPPARTTTPPPGVAATALTSSARAATGGSANHDRPPSSVDARAENSSLFAGRVPTASDPEAAGARRSPPFVAIPSDVRLSQVGEPGRLTKSCQKVSRG